MGRLRELNDQIISVTEEKDAITLVGTWQPDQKAAFSSGMGVQKGVRNCSLAALFCIAFYKRDPHLKLGKQSVGMKPEKFDFRTHLKGDGCILVTAEDHNMAIIAEGKECALYQAWEGDFHLFPRLNEDGESHNIFGMGEDTVRLINQEVAFAYRKANTPDGKQMDPKGDTNEGKYGGGYYNVTTW
jgi:hypothetical protein